MQKFDLYFFEPKLGRFSLVATDYIEYFKIFYYSLMDQSASDYN